jgi:hypothetical protein
MCFPLPPQRTFCPGLRDVPKLLSAR